MGRKKYQEMQGGTYDVVFNFLIIRVPLATFWTGVDLCDLGSFISTRGIINPWWSFISSIRCPKFRSITDHRWRPRGMPSLGNNNYFNDHFAMELMCRCVAKANYFMSTKGPTEKLIYGDIFVNIFPLSNKFIRTFNGNVKTIILCRHFLQIPFCGIHLVN